MRDDRVKSRFNLTPRWIRITISTLVVVTASFTVMIVIERSRNVRERAELYVELLRGAGSGSPSNIHIETCERGLFGLPLLVRREIVVFQSNAPIQRSVLFRIVECREIEEFRLTGQTLDEEFATRLPGLERLRKLELLSCTLAGDWGGLCGMAQLREVSLRGSDIPAGSGAVLGECDGLTSVNLTSTSFNDEDLEDLVVNNLELQEVHLSDTHVTGVGLRVVSGHPSIRAVSLVGIAIGDDAVAALASIPALEELNLSRTGVSDRGVEHLRGHRCLEVLYLTGCSDVTNKSVEVLKTLPQIDTVVVAETQIDEVGREELSTRLREESRAEIDVVQ